MRWHRIVARWRGGDPGLTIWWYFFSAASSKINDARQRKRHGLLLGGLNASRKKKIGPELQDGSKLWISHTGPTKNMRFILIERLQAGFDLH